MDHNTAIRLEAAELYVAGRLPDAERDQFEEHFFECAECAEEVRWEQVFAANMRAAFREESLRTPARAAAPARNTESWFSFAWFRPAFAASALANVMLLGMVAYQGLRIVPGLRSELGRAEEPQLAAPIAVPTVVRGEPQPIVIRPSGTRFSLSFASPRPFARYSYQVSREGGASEFSGTLAGPASAGDELLLSLPVSRFEAGAIYRVVLSGLEPSTPVVIGSCRVQLQP